MSFSNKGKVWHKSNFPAYLNGLKDSLTWADSVTVHHTWNPDLAMRPNGILGNHIENLYDWYSRKLGWSAGPHFFVDRDEVFGLTPPTGRGVHAISFNRNSIAVEMLGNFDKDDPRSGRGLEVVRMSAFVVASILKAMGRPANSQTIHFHRDDPRSSKTCPGTLIDKEWFIGLVREEMKPKACGLWCRVIESLKQIFHRNA